MPIIFYRNMISFVHFTLIIYFNFYINLLACQKNMTNNDQQIQVLQTIKKNDCFTLYKVLYQRKQSFAKNINVNIAQQYQIIDSVQFTLDILENAAKEQVFQDNFVNIHKITNEQANSVAIISQPYTMNLQDYLKSKVIQEGEALEIFEDIFKSVYSFYCSARWHRNLRPCHFVKIGKKWKIESFVFDISTKRCQVNQYCSDRTYQPPQAYEKDQFTQIELDQMIVWNLGSLLVDILLSNHRLSKLQTLTKFKNQSFSFEAIGVKFKFSNDLCLRLGKMLHFNPEKRAKYADLFNDPFWSTQVFDHYKKTGKELLNLSLTRKKTFDPRKSQISSIPLKRVQTISQKKQTSNKSRGTLNEDFYLQVDLMENSKPSAFASKRLTKTPKSIKNPFTQIHQQENIMEQGHVPYYPQTSQNQSNFWYFFFENDEDDEQQLNEPAIAPFKNFQFPKNYFENQMEQKLTEHQ